MSLKIALLCACPYPVPQGSQVFLRENALALKARGHAVHLVVYGHGLGEDNSGLPLHRARALPFARHTHAGPTWAKPLQDVALALALRRVIRREKIDVVIAHNYEALLVALAVGKRPILYHAHNVMGDELPHYFTHKKIPERIGCWLDRTFPRRADAVIAPHARLAGHLIVRGCDQDKVHVIPPPLNAEDFKMADKEKVLPPVLYTGNLDAYQNLDLLYAAMKIVRETIPEARLCIATAQEAEIEQAEIISVHDRASLSHVLAQDAVFAAPRVSWSGYPVKLLNAMAAGQAIVACESAAYPLEDGKSALIVADNDPLAYGQALLRCLQNAKLRARLGMNARKRLQENHHPDQVAEALEEVVLTVLRNRD